MDKKILLQNLADSLAERTGITKRKAEAFVRSFFEITEEGLIADGIVKAKGFGTTKIVNVNGRESVNINTGERFQIEGHAKVTFTPDAPFRDLVNRPFAHFTTIILDDDVDIEELNAVDALAPLPNEDPEDDLEEQEPDAPIEAQEAPDGTSAEQQDVAAGLNAEPADAETENVETSVVTVEEEAETTEEEAETTEEEAETTEEEAETTEEEAETTEEEAEATEEEAETTEEEAETTEEEAETTEEEAETAETTPDPAALTSTNEEQESDDMQPIIIQNTVPAPPTNNWWRIAFFTLIAILMAVASYFAGYYRVFCPCTDCEDAEKTTAPQAATEKTAATQAATEKTCPAAAQTPTATTAAAEGQTAAATKAETPAPVEPEADPAPRQQGPTADELAAAKNYEQLDGDYLITGVLKTHEMAVGDNLYKLAKSNYGDKDLARYIIHHNHFSNPDVLTIGQKIEIPRLTHK